MLKAEFADHLTPQDRATVDYVLQTLEAACEMCT